MSLITGTELRINDQIFGVDGGCHLLNIRVDPPAGDPGIYSYIAVVEKIKDGFHVHWEKSLAPPSPPSEFFDSVSKVMLYVVGAFCIAAGLFTMAFFFKKSENKKIELLEVSVCYIITGLAMVLWARNNYL